MGKKILIVIIALLNVMIFSTNIYNFEYSLKNNSRVAETKYFKFIFEKNLSYIFPVLNKVVDKLYENYEDFYETSPGSITVFVYDDVDFVNSFAIPHLNIIRLYVNQPDSSIGLTENVRTWLPFVFSHELNHVFYGNMRNKYIDWIPYDFIKKGLLSMNWQPSYLHEGLSIYMESKYFKGRFEDSIFNMYLMAEIISNKYPEYYLGSGSMTDKWSPAGFNYMYGAIFTKEISEKYGEETLKKIIQDMNSKLFFNTIKYSFEKVTGEKWKDFLLYIKVKYKNLYLGRSEKGYKDNYKPLNNAFHYTGNLNTDGEKLYYYGEFENKIKGVYKGDEYVGNYRKFSISKDGKLLYLSSITNNNENRNILYLKCDCPLSDKIIANRVRSFNFIDNNRVVYTTIKNGFTTTYIMDLRTGNKEKIISEGYYVINNFTSNGKEVYFSANFDNTTDIYKYEIETGNLLRLTRNQYTERDLFLYNDYLYFSADYEDNIYNIYRYNIKNKKLEKITNHIYGTFNPVIIKEKLYFIFYDENGYHISTLNLDNLSKKLIETVEFNEYIAVSPLIYHMKPDKYSKYEEKTKYNYIIPLVYNNKIGVGYISLSEGLNYGFGAGVLTDINNTSMIVGGYLNLYTNNFILSTIGNEGIYTDISISKDFQFYLKSKYYLTISNNLQLHNISPVSNTFSINITNNPYYINSIQLYNYNVSMNINNAYTSINISKPFYVFSFVTTPYGYYDTSGNLVLGTSFSKKIWNPDISIFDGKFRFDNLYLTGNISYNIPFHKTTCGISLIFNFTEFYWANVPIPIKIIDFSN
ncbi:hypothetical protein XO10_08250 [Marinitoga sp. 1135]|uniref:hypothetical protein n=1 Tax=Marinitoga sp. 1135 TaxID=1643333 RepID=UPI0015869A80|nr:hypothetical protein [Marinitoga sp. 1135]NUU96253.1 hypothetical protein [Marinitoga sp. 1135]